MAASRVRIPPSPLYARPEGRALAHDDTLARPGEVSEWSKERDWKSRTCCKVRRGFKSRPLRLEGRRRSRDRALGCGQVLPDREPG